MSHRIPKSAGEALNVKKRLVSSGDVNFDTFPPAWRIGKFDYKSRWGLNTLLGMFCFNNDIQITEKVIELGDEKLNEILEEFDKKEFSSIKDFWHKLSVKYGGPIPSEIIEDISEYLVRDGFQRKIYPKLKSFEDNTWIEILSFKHRHRDRMVTNSHNVPVANLCKEARDRLEELNYNVDEIFSLRLEAMKRIYGLRVQNYLEILWVDLNHEVYDLDD